MRKNQFFAILALLSCTMSFAQHKIKFGANGGATYANFRGNPYIEMFKRDLDFMVGISADCYIREHLSVKANLSYERKSATDKQQIEFRENFDDPPVIYDVRFKLHYDYITLPVMAKLEFSKDYSFFVEGGVFVGYLLSAKATNDLPVAIDGGGEEDFTGATKKIDGGLSFGIGKTFKMNDKHDLVIELRDNIGLLNISDVAVVDNGSIKTNSLNLIVGFTFGK